VNFVEVDIDNYMEKVRYYLDNEKERRRIANNAYAMVRKYHSSDMRAKQLIGYLEELL